LPLYEKNWKANHSFFAKTDNFLAFLSLKIGIVKGTIMKMVSKIFTKIF